MRILGGMLLAFLFLGPLVMKVAYLESKESVQKNDFDCGYRRGMESGLYLAWWWMIFTIIAKAMMDGGWNLLGGN